jgi:cbb3-type cytochrome oxidase maturation protein
MTTDDFIIYAVLIGSIVILGGATILALAWAVRDGQFQNFERNARSIFDPDEPVGQLTDRFPGEGAEERPQ